MDHRATAFRRIPGTVRSLAAAVAILIAGYPVAVDAQGAGTIEGTVLSAADGSPVVAATVQIVGTDRATHTDARGRFRLTSVPAGTHHLIARRLGLQPGEQSVTVAAGAAASVTFRLAEEALLIPAVVISATRETQRLSQTAASVGVVSGAELQAARPTHPSQIMSQIPGVWVNVTGGEGHMTSIRQPQTTKPVYLFLEDGVPTRSTGFFNHNALYEVNLPQADRVEVLKGPASALYGSDAIGGVINVETRRPSLEPSLEAYLERGEFGYSRFMGSASATVRENGLRGDLNLTRSDGWRDGTGYDRQTGTLRWDGSLGASTSVRTVLTGSLIDQQTAGSSALTREQYEISPSRNNTPISFRTVRALRLSSTADVRLDRTMLSVTPFVRWNEMEMLPNWTLTFDPNVQTSGHRSFGLLARARRDFDPLAARIITGVDLDYSPGFRRENRITATRVDGIFSQFTAGDVIYDYDVTFRGISPYAQVDASPTEALHLTAGLRYDHMAYDYRTHLEPLQTGRWRRPENATRSYDSFSPKLGISYDFGNSLNLFANYTRGFRAPSEGQLFRQGSAVNTLDLRPVTANSYEVGARGQILGRVGYSAALYDMAVTNDILNFTLPDGSPETQNSGATRHRGLEAGLNVRVTEELRADVGYTYAVHTYERWSPRPTIDYAGNRMESAPNTIINGRLNYSPPLLRGSRFGAEWNRVGGYWLDPDNTSRYEGHDLFNLHGNVELPHDFQLVARVLNVVDTRYAESASFTQARGEELAPGMPRTVYLGLQYRWGR